MNNTTQEFNTVFGENRLKRDVSLKSYTSFKLGGPAEYFLEVNILDDLIKACKIAYKRKIPLLIIGGGTNIIVSDNGVQGLVIKNNCRKFDVAGMKGKVNNQKVNFSQALVFAESGAIMNQCVRFTIENGLSGLEYQFGLPGTVGGAVYMNSNFPKKNVRVGDCIYSVKILKKDGSIQDVDRSYFRFAYDKSILQETREIVLSVLFKLSASTKDTLWKKALEALQYRNSTQPKGASAGCTFRNISIVDAIRIPTPNNIISAGYLIDKSGLKGKRVGDAMVSPMHANYILNMGNAKALDVVKLANLVKEEVVKKFGVHLQYEVEEIGF